MQQLLRKAVAAGFLVLVALWVAGIVRGLTLPYPEPSPLVMSFSSGEEYSARSNLSSNMKQLGLADTPLTVVLDQPQVDKIEIIEKNAHLATGTLAFDEDLPRIRSAFVRSGAVVFNEKDFGIAPARRLTVEVGVHPEKFDVLVDQLKAIGQLQSVSVQQRDRTGDFRKLNAQRHSLKRYLEAIEKLRGAGKAALDDSLKLEQRIQDIEKELQSLSVQIGDLLGKESYYHVFVTLHEFQSGSRQDHSYTVPQRVGHALVWAVAWWFAVAAAVGVGVGTYVSARILRDK